MPLPHYPGGWRYYCDKCYTRISEFIPNDNCDCFTTTPLKVHSNDFPKQRELVEKSKRIKKVKKFRVRLRVLLRFPNCKNTKRFPPHIWQYGNVVFPN